MLSLTFSPDNSERKTIFNEIMKINQDVEKAEDAVQIMKEVHEYYHPPSIDKLDKKFEDIKKKFKS
jgi:hypothetical protein